jgi:hypothetical protein
VEDCGAWVLLWRKKVGRRIGGELRKGVVEVSWFGVWKREPVERLRFMDMVAVRYGCVDECLSGCSRRCD